MRNKLSDMAQLLLAGFIAAIILYCFVAALVFNFRHPWATKTERFVYFFDALQFKTIPYGTMRPRN